MQSKSENNKIVWKWVSFSSERNYALLCSCSVLFFLLLSLYFTRFCRRRKIPVCASETQWAEEQDKNKRNKFIVWQLFCYCLHWVSEQILPIKLNRARWVVIIHSSIIHFYILIQTMECECWARSTHINILGEGGKRYRERSLVLAHSHSQHNLYIDSVRTIFLQNRQ